MKGVDDMTEEEKQAIVDEIIKRDVGILSRKMMAESSLLSMALERRYGAKVAHDIMRCALLANAEAYRLIGTHMELGGPSPELLAYAEQVGQQMFDDGKKLEKAYADKVAAEKVKDPNVQ